MRNSGCSAGIDRVAVIEPVGGHGGMNYYDFGLCGGLSASGVEVTLYTCDRTHAPEGMGFTVCTVFRGIFGPQPAWMRGFRYLLGTVRSMWRAVSRGEKIVHLHFFHVGPLECFNVVVARATRRKVVCTVHDVEAFSAGLTIPLFERIAYALADVFITHNEVSRQAFLKRADVPERAVWVIPHGNYVGQVGETTDRTIARVALGLPLNCKVVLFFGQIKEVKGLDILIDAMAIAREHMEDVRLVIAGKVWKDSFERYQTQIEKLGIADRVTSEIRYIQDSEVNNFLSSADVIVCPYRKIYQSGVVLMAMSAGCPVIASDIPGMKEVIEDEVTGYLFESGNASSLAIRLLHVLGSPDHARQVAIRAKEVMATDYTWNRIGEKTAECYQKIH